MIKLRTASALAVGAAAALAIGGTALAAGNDDSPSVPLLPNGDVITSAAPSPSASSDDSGFDDSASPSPSASTDDSSPSPSASSSASSAGTISLDRAKTIAIRAAGGGRVTNAERETEHGRAVWDIDVLSAGVEHDIDVDRATGAVLRHKTDKSTSDSRSTSGGSDDSSTHDRNDDHGGKDDKGGDDHGRHGGHGSDDNSGHDSNDDHGSDD